MDGDGDGAGVLLIIVITLLAIAGGCLSNEWDKQREHEMKMLEMQQPKQASPEGE